MSDMYSCQFGNSNANVGSGLTGSYIALREPILSEGVALRTYQTDPSTNQPIERSSVTIEDPRPPIDNAGHVLLGSAV